MAIRKPTLELINIQQTLDHLHDTLRIDDGQKRDLGPERIPQAIKTIEPDSLPGDQRDVSRIVLGVDHGAVDPTVEIRDERVVGTSCRYAYGTEFLSPSIRSRRTFIERYREYNGLGPSPSSKDTLENSHSQCLMKTKFQQ